MKRILIAAVVAAFVITGCGREEPTKKGPSTPTPQVTPPASTAPGNTTTAPSPMPGNTATTPSAMPGNTQTAPAPAPSDDKK